MATPLYLEQQVGSSPQPLFPTIAQMDQAEEIPVYTHQINY